MNYENMTKEQLIDELLVLRQRNTETKEAEQAFHEAVLYNIEDGIVACNSDGVLTLFNRATREFHGLPEKEIPANEWAKYYDLYCSDGKTQMDKTQVPLFRALQGERVKNSEMVIAPLKGKKRTLLANGQPLFDSEGIKIGAVVSMHDITDRKLAENALKKHNARLEALVEERTRNLNKSNEELQNEIIEHQLAERDLQESEKNYRELVENANSIIIRSLPDGTITFSNEFSQKFFGFDASEIIGKNVIGSIVPEKESTGRDSKQMVADILKNLAKYEQNENENICKDGKRVWVNWTNRAILNTDGTLKEILSIGNDITARREAEKNLALERKQLLSIFDGMDEVIYVADPETYELLYINGPFRKQWGNAIGKKCYKVMQNFDSPCPFCSNHIIFKENPGSSYVWEWQNKVNNYWYRCIDKTIQWPKGKTVRFEMAIDITDQKKAEEQLRQAQKMEAIGTLAGGIAHDFNNILAGILGYTELAQDDAGQDSPVQEYLVEILKSTTRARDLVKQILTFSRKSHEEQKPILLHPVIQEATKLLRSIIPTTIEIKQNINDTTGMVNADSTQMHQIVMNLCTNAAHAMPGTEGVLEIELSLVVITQESMSNYHNISPGPFLELKISDTGTGIDSKIIHRIFEPFFTTKNKEKGTGMGLAVVHGIVKDHGGDISIDSQLGKGTTFRIMLPQIIAEPYNKEDSSSKVPTGTEHILFVDDEQILMDLGKRTLESLGYTVTAKNNSIEALETFQQAPDEFDIIITDQTMPHMTGYNLAKRILEIKPSVNIILCTGYSETVTPEKVATTGIKALINKPISKKEIAQKIRRVLDKHNHAYL